MFVARLCLPFLLLFAPACVPVPLPSSSGSTAPETFVEDARGARLNAFRAENGMAPLSFSPVLQEVAAAHARDMAARGEMTHTGSDGSSIGDRIQRSGYRLRAGAENIAVTRGGLDAAMRIWIDSPPHRANMLMPRVREYGLAQSGNYWAMVVAGAR
ncbi:CAP domain-containing protein [Salipiger marinus]|uniref:CAP domain-containing protein n=1 Tax=Salipiger marinus TaxID=555512 RepID=UPI002B93EBEE|nr:CAP domain-containing protein [Salipiger manganoxidans]MEB3418969.1 CAP domain-containing protein [Salipiger manganoxidans]